MRSILPSHGGSSRFSSAEHSLEGSGPLAHPQLPLLTEEVKPPSVARMIAGGVGHRFSLSADWDAQLMRYIRSRRMTIGDAQSKLTSV